MRLAHADDVKVQLPSQKNFDLIFAIEREVITDRCASVRAEWQVLTRPLVLNECGRNLEDVGNRIDRGIRHSKPADRTRCREVILQEHRGHRENTRNVVEALLIGLIRCKQRFAVDLQPEQVTYGIRVLSTVQPVNSNATGIWSG